MDFAFNSNYPKIARESGFRLCQFKDGPLDWRLVGSMEVDRILREQQFEQIDAILLHLSEAPLASLLDSNVLDSGVAKYFALSQLALQYMIFCRKFLDKSVQTLRENIIKLETQNIHLRTINREHTDNILQLHKKLSQVEAIHEIVFPCHVCTKNFVSNDALNVHLSKKHLKSPSLDIQEKTKDKTLINTIKLELEIKNLKERLNVAEKDIQQTTEIKKTVSPREVIKLNSSTQIEMETRNVGTQISFDKTKKNDSWGNKDIGTQCNLIEIKEFDSADDARNQSIFNDSKESNCDVNYVDVSKVDILFDIQEKISKLEALQETYSNGNQQSINEIKQKLGEIIEFLEIQSTQNVEDVTKNAILSNTSNINLTSTSIDELHKMLSKMFSEVSQLNFERTNQIITRVEKNEQKLSIIEVENKKKVQPNQDQTIQTLKSQSSMNKDSSKQTQDAIKDQDTSSHLKRAINSIETSKYSSSEAQSDIFSSNNTSQVESHHSSLLRKEKYSDDLNAFNKIENKMTLFGLDDNCKRITALEASNILGQVLEQRNASKLVYPTFYKTRKRLNKLVELFIFEKKFYCNKLKTHEKNHKRNDIAEEKNKFPIIIDENITSKKRIRRILRPPVKKPTNNVARNNLDEIKPIPMPRKHVMFDTEKEENRP